MKLVRIIGVIIIFFGLALIVASKNPNYQNETQAAFVGIGLLVGGVIIINIDKIIKK